MKSPLKYPGGKSKEIPKIITHIPKDYDRYIEPFVGGGSLFFHLEPKKAIISDLNDRLINFYKTSRNEFPVMLSELNEINNVYKQNQKDYFDKLTKTPDIKIHNKNADLYYEMRNRYNYPDKKYLDATVYYFINKTAYAGMTRYNRKNEFNIPFGHYKNMTMSGLTQEYSDLLNDSIVLCEDFEKVFSLSNKDDFIFLDPPYETMFTDYGNLELKNGFGEDQQKRLAGAFKNLTAKTLMIIGKTPLIESLYSGYIFDEYSLSYSVNIRNRFGREATHLVIKNY